MTDSLVRLRSKELAAPLAALDASARERPWTDAHFATALRGDAGQGVFTLADESAARRVVLVEQCVVDEAELLLIVTSPGAQRQGLARRLLRAWHAHLAQRGVRTVHLEVHRANLAARALYEAESYTESGVRRGYYTAPPGDAILYTRALVPLSETPQGMRHRNT